MPRLSWAICLLVLLSWTTQAALAGPIDFSRDVLPILSDACFRCHGPDEGSRQAELRLDQQEGAFRVRDGVAVITPGDVAKSELITRILATDASVVMPPPDMPRQLSKAEVDTLQRWIQEGAHWGQHWAFLPMQSVAPPAVQDEHWPRNPIDQYVLARLEAEGFRPAPPTTRERWLRRVTFDLTGLPPTIAELEAYLADTSAGADEAVVDRLLTSRRYAERMAADWLDVARFADTHGYQADRERPMWPYRDWVLRAFESNLPFDQFLTWQLAGDLLPDATRDQRLATAFNRLHLQNEEGGIVAEEFRISYIVDRVNTMGTAFLGLTFECSRCHDHKYDPLTQRDFYALSALFSNIDEYGQTTYFTNAMPVPTLALPDAATEEQLRVLQAKVDEQTSAHVQSLLGIGTRFLEWLPQRGSWPAALRPLAHFSFDDSTGKNSADEQKSLNVAGGDFVTGKVGMAARSNGDGGFTSANFGAFTRSDSFSFAAWLRPEQSLPRQVVFHWSKAPADAGSRGYELLLEDDRLSFGLHHMWPGNSLKVTTHAKLPVGEWTHVAITYNGASRADGLRVYLNGQPANVEVIRDKLIKDITYEGGPPEFQIGFRFRDNGYRAGQVDELYCFDRVLTGLEIGELSGQLDPAAVWSRGPANWSEADLSLIEEYYVQNIDQPTAATREALRQARRDYAAAYNVVPEIMVMQELPEPKPTYILVRGAYDAHGPEVTADVPACLPPWPADQPRNRLGLARWLLDPEHPLTARVTVNRLWQQCFGTGLVATADNFGRQGATPTHPELLDWLARDFIAGGWDVRRVLKQIVLSATYRQASQGSPELQAHDPQNHLLGRAPVRRLTAEMLRDQSLLLSGLLVEQFGGPSVKPYQPDGLWDVASASHYDQGHGSDLYRRSLYTYWKRTVPPPSMLTFDAAERSVCSVRRQNTSTPLQALTLLNDIQQVEAARLLAQRMLREGGSRDEERTAWLFRTILLRVPSPAEAAVLLQALQEQRALFNTDPQACSALLSVGETRCDAALSPVELAAGTMLAQLLLNHDEAVHLR